MISGRCACKHYCSTSVVKLNTAEVEFYQTCAVVIFVMRTADQVTNYILVLLGKNEKHD